MKGGCLKNTPPFRTINPQPTIYPQSNFTPLPDQNNPSKINLDPIKDSALNIISLNIRSLTIKENSVKLKRIFNPIITGVWELRLLPGGGTMCPPKKIRKSPYYKLLSWQTNYIPWNIYIIVVYMPILSPQLQKLTPLEPFEFLIKLIYRGTDSGCF